MTDFSAFDGSVFDVPDDHSGDAPTQPTENRAAMRVLVPGRVDFAHDGRSVAGYVVNLSYGGARLLLDVGFTGVVGEVFTATLPALELVLTGTVAGITDSTGREIRVQWVNPTASERALLASAVAVQIARPRRTG